MEGLMSRSKRHSKAVKGDVSLVMVGSSLIALRQYDGSVSFAMNPCARRKGNRYLMTDDSKPGQNRPDEVDPLSATAMFLRALDQQSEAKPPEPAGAKVERGIPAERTQAPAVGSRPEAAGMNSQGSLASRSNPPLNFPCDRHRRNRCQRQSRFGR